MTVPYTVEGDAFRAGQPRVWSRIRPVDVSAGITGMWDLAPDGKRVVAMLGTEQDAEKPITHVTMLLNFFDEVRRRLGRAE